MWVPGAPFATCLLGPEMLEAATAAPLRAWCTSVGLLESSVVLGTRVRFCCSSPLLRGPVPSLQTSLGAGRRPWHLPR